MMRVCVIGNTNVYNRYLIDQIAANFQLCGLVRPVVPVFETSRPRNWRQLASPFKLAEAYLTVNHNNRRDKRYHAVGEAMLSDSPLPDPEKIPLIDILRGQINSRQAVATISQLEPDVIVVSNAPVLKPEIFNIARLACLNVHYGIAPHYRGEHSLYWPLRMGDYENIGATIHHIDKGVDTGRVLARAYTALEPQDTEFSVFARTTKLAVEVLVDILADIERKGVAAAGVAHATNSPAGRFIRLRDRRIWHDMEYGIRRRLLPSKIPTRASRVERYYLHGG